MVKCSFGLLRDVCTKQIGRRTHLTIVLMVIAVATARNSTSTREAYSGRMGWNLNVGDDVALL